MLFGCRSDALWLMSRLKGNASVLWCFLSGASKQSGGWPADGRTLRSGQKNASQGYRNEVRASTRNQDPDGAKTNGIRQTARIARHRKGGACDGLPSNRDSTVTQAACATCV
jgi:hypothetical protein